MLYHLQLLPQFLLPKGNSPQFLTHLHLTRAPSFGAWYHSQATPALPSPNSLKISQFMDDRFVTYER